jgi:hypothetical protein
MKATSNPTDTLLSVPFYVDSIQPAPAPEGGTGSWYRYVVKQGPTNTITGIRSGTREEVSERLDVMVATLNERRLGKYKAPSKGRPPLRGKQNATEPQAG